MSGLEALLIKAKGAAKRGEAEAARAIYRQVLDRFPANKRAISALRELERPAGTPAQLQFDAVVAAYQAGRMEEAARQGAVLAEAYPHLHGVQNLLGAALLALGENEKAEQAFRRALAADPDAHASYNNLAIALRRQGMSDEAERVYRAVIARAPDYADARYNLAALLEQDGRVEAAAALYAEAIAIAPDYVDAYYNLGNLLAKAGRREEALASFARAVELRPGHSDAHNNMAAEYLHLSNGAAALDAAQHAIAANAENRQAHINRGKALVLLSRRAEAAAAFRTALALDPQDGAVRLQAMFEEAHICDWSSRSEFPLTRARADAPAQPFAALIFADDPAHQKMRSLAAAAHLFPPERPALPQPEPAADGRIRIGYFSADFHDHATMFLLSGLFREHDRSRFEVHALSYGPVRENHAARIELRRHVDGFHEIGAMRDEDIVALGRGLHLDIAVDLKGFTLGSRLRLFGHRLAPLQVSYLGYPGTAGHPALDYFIADETCLPCGAETGFVEKIVRLPHAYQPNDNRRAAVPDTRGRAGHGLPPQGFVFCCFNQNYKISPAEWDIWMNLLREVEGSVLWLLRSSPDAETNLRREAEMRGVAADRLVFADMAPHGDHLGRLALADLFLDTFAVNAHTTASDALWAGLPVLTLAGRQFAARVAASLVTAAGLGELVTTTAQDYATLALRLARDPQNLAALRARLADNRMACPLFDTPAYTRHIETAFAHMHDRHRKGLPPAHFSVA